MGLTEAFTQYSITNPLVISDDETLEILQGFDKKQKIFVL